MAIGLFFFLRASSKDRTTIVEISSSSRSFFKWGEEDVLSSIFIHDVLLNSLDICTKQSLSLALI